MIRLLKRILPAIMAIVIFASGCAGQNKTEDDNLSLYDKIQHTLKNLETYEATVAIRYISNNNHHEYMLKQYAKISGEYRVEVTSPENVAGNITIFDGKVISQYNSKISGKIAIGTTESSERSEIFLTSFIKNYFAQQEAAIAVDNMDEDGELTILEAKVPGGNAYLATEKLFMENETLKPTELVVYDEDGNERIIVIFKEIEYNVDLDDNLFSIER